jgi:hypothetical protein
MRSAYQEHGLERTVVSAVVLALAACAGPAAPARPTAAASAPREWISDPVEYQDRGLSAAQGKLYFDELGGGDPYATGIAYPMLLAMMEAYPGDLGPDMSAFSERFGLLRDPEAPEGALPIGLHLTRDPITHVDFVMTSCRMCHAERLRLPGGDRIVSGLGSSRVRAHAYDDALTRIARDPSFDAERLLPIATRAARAHDVPWPADMAMAIARETVRKMKERARARGDGPTRLANALPGRIATIESFAMAIGLGVGHTGPIGWAKIPDVRGFPYRDTLSWDGVGTGSPVALAAEADFAFGARPQWFESHRHIATDLYLYLRHFERRLPYPGPIDAALARRGESVFEARCSRCHGLYSAESPVGRVRYREQVIPIEVVGTDAARAEAVTPAFVAAANAVPLAHGVTTVARTMGYVPPVLLDVWARGQYGHAGQWPSIEVMAMKPADRPRRYVVDLDAAYDVARMGHAWGPVTAKPERLERGQYFYDAGATGYSVDGHPFLCDLPADDRQAVLEHLKTL